MFKRAETLMLILVFVYVDRRLQSQVHSCGMLSEDYHVLWRRLDALLWSKALKYSCNSCLACSDIAGLFDELIVEEKELLEDDGVRHRCCEP